MGRRKIEIKFIENEKNRKSTFDKRKEGLIKKAYELSELTGASIGLVVVSELGPVELYTNKDFFKKYKEEEIPDENVIVADDIKKIYGKKWKLNVDNNNNNNCKSDVNKQRKKRKLNYNDDFKESDLYYSF